MSLKLQILMALVSCAAVKAQCLDLGLGDTESKCTSCFEFVTCDKTAPVPTDCAATGQICLQEGATAASCVLPGSYSCVTCPAGSFAACDPFNPNLVDTCVAGQPTTLFENCTVDNKICQNGVCVAGTATTPSPGNELEIQCREATNATDPGDQAFIAFKPECTSGLLCKGGNYVSSVNCTDGQYFDPATRQCQSLPVNNCEGQADGVAPYRTDCTKYVTCNEGEQVEDHKCEAATPVFDTTTNECIDPFAPGSNLACADLVGCTFGSNGSGGSSETTSGSDETTTAETTTSSSTTKPEECSADNVNQRYPIEEDCKSYWVCRKTSSSTYAYIEAQCSGSLVYNPETTYCDLPENVPGC